MNPTEPTSHLPSSDEFPVIQESTGNGSTSLAERVAEKTWELLDERISASDLAQLNRDLESSIEARVAYTDAITLHVGLTDLFAAKRSS
jgi:hypothetical protein